jgi:hypothetical protein
MKSLITFLVAAAAVSTAFAAAPPPTVAFTSSTFTASEANGMASVDVTFSGPKASFSVNYTTHDGTAIGGTDYTGGSGTLNFTGSQRTQTIQIPLLEDPSGDGAETFTVELTSASGATIGTPSTTTVTVVEDSIQFTAATATVSEADGSVTLNVTRTGDDSLTIHVPFATGNPTDPNLTPATPGSDYQAQSGTLIFAPGETTKAIKITVNDDAVYTGDRSFNVTLGPLDPSESVMLSNPSVTTVTITDNEPVPPTPTPTTTPAPSGTPVACGTPGAHPNNGQKVQFSAGTFTVAEDGQNAELTLKRVGSSSGAAIVHFATADGTATAGLDYTATSGDVSWCDGDNADKTISIPILDDTLYDPDETFTVTLTNPQGVNLGTTASATVTIAENAIKFTSASYGVTQKAGTATLTVVRTGETDGQVTVHYATSDGTAIAGTNYTAASGDLTFAPGVSSQDVTVPITDDPNYDPPTTFNVTLTAPTGSAVLATPSTAVVTIAETEVHFSAATATVNEDDGTVTLTILRTGDTSATSGVNVTTSDGTAQDGSDYVGTSTLLAFKANETSKTIDIEIIDDFVYEGDETFTVTLSVPTGSTVIGKPDATVVTIVENDPKPTPTPTATPSGTPSGTPTPTPNPKPYAVSQNISTRGFVGTNDDALIGGFIVKGTVAKNVVIRALGPSLTGAGVGNALQDPVLTLFKTGISQSLATSDNWKDGQQSQVQATGVAPTNDAESAIVATLQPGNYTAVVTGKDGGTGVALVEIYDLNSRADSELANISTRGDVQADPNVLIGGFILGDGSPNKTSVIVRAIGPSLSDQGVPNPLSDPTLDVRDSNGARVAFNDDWQSDAQAGVVSANGIAPTNPKESALALTLPGGKYTAVVAGKGGAAGVGLVEVYNTH